MTHPAIEAATAAYAEARYKSGASLIVRHDDMKAAVLAALRYERKEAQGRVAKTWLEGLADLIAEIEAAP